MDCNHGILDPSSLTQNRRNLYCIGCMYLWHAERRRNRGKGLKRSENAKYLHTSHIISAISEGRQDLLTQVPKSYLACIYYLGNLKDVAIIHGLGQAKSTTAAGASVDLVVARLLPLFQLLEAPWKAGSNSGLHSAKLEETFGAFLPLHLTTLVGPSLSALQQTNANQLIPGFPKLTFAAPLPKHPKHRAFPNNPFYSFSKVPFNIHQPPTLLSVPASHSTAWGHVENHPVSPPARPHLASRPWLPTFEASSRHQSRKLEVEVVDLENLQHKRREEKLEVIPCNNTR